MVECNDDVIDGYNLGTYTCYDESRWIDVLPSLVQCFHLMVSNILPYVISDECFLAKRQ